MALFKTGRLDADQLTDAKKELDSIFGIVREAALASRSKKPTTSVYKKLEADKFEIAELVFLVLQEQFLLADPMALFVDQVDGDFRNDYLWREKGADSGLRVINRAYGTKPISQRLTYKEFSIATAPKEIAVEIPLEQIAAGSTTASEVTEAIAIALVRDRLGFLLETLDAGITAVADRSGKAGFVLRYSGFTQGNTDNAIDGLLDEAESPTVLGRWATLAPTIRTFTGWSDDYDAELNSRGIVGTYHGAQILPLRDQANKYYNNEHIVPLNRVYMAGGTKGAIWMDKDMSFLNWSMLDQRTATFGTGMRLEYGMLMYDAYRYRLIEAA